MNYKDIENGFAYVGENAGLVKVIGKNAGWVNVELASGETKRMRASELKQTDDSAGQALDPDIHAVELPPVMADFDEVDHHLHGQTLGRGKRLDKPAPVEVEHVPYFDAAELREKITTPAKKVREKRDGEKIKINGFKYRIKRLNPGDVLSRRCMFRRPGDRFKPVDPRGFGSVITDNTPFEYIEILSGFYLNP